MNSNSINRKHYFNGALSPVFLIITAVLSVSIGIFFCFLSTRFKIITKSEAISFSGEFQSYESGKNYCGINFADGSYYEVYPHTESKEFRKAMIALKIGTTLDILIEPNCEYIIEVKTDSTELLNFEQSQQDIYEYERGYNIIGVIACVTGITLIILAIFDIINRLREKGRRQKANSYDTAEYNFPAIRYADFTENGRVLLSATVDDYKIIYRRIKITNELIINGKVYDQKKALIEFPHALYAILDNHRIEAGLDSHNFSYIRFDGEPIREKERLI